MIVIEALVGLTALAAILILAWPALIAAVSEDLGGVEVTELERIAAFVEDHPSDLGHWLDPDGNHSMEQIVRLVLQAIRSPTQEMYEASYRVSPAPGITVSRIWQAMIDHLLA